MDVKNYCQNSNYKYVYYYYTIIINTIITNMYIIMKHMKYINTESV